MGTQAIINYYRITPDQHRDDPNTPQYRGCLVADFQDASSRYLLDTKLPITPVTPVATDRETGSGTEGIVMGPGVDGGDDEFEVITTI